MTTNKNVERYLWISSVMFVTYLLLSSFIVSKNLLELGYLSNKSNLDNMINNMDKYVDAIVNSVKPLYKTTN